ncbi:hypothetical protein BE11_18930 [Sorangium cellulosum]|nr:hypothetical protein BE11_18930 [Sorangium cellulosum]
MVTRMERTERSALTTHGDELARIHDADDLLRALCSRLNLDGFHILGRMIGKSASAEEAAGGPFGRAVFYAIALIGRLRVEGRSELADAVVALLSDGPPEVDPVLWLHEAHGFIAVGRERAARYRARGLHKQADDADAHAWTYLKGYLVQRLDADGHVDLARAIGRECSATVHRERDQEVPLTKPSPAAAPRESTLIETLARTYPPDVWAYAAVKRLRADGRAILAGSIMMFWAWELVGPMVDPNQLATELLAELRAHGREALADTLDSLLRGASTARDPCELMALWLEELAGPMVDPEPLAAALVAALRNEKHEELARSVALLLSAGG